MSKMDLGVQLCSQPSLQNGQTSKIYIVAIQPNYFDKTADKLTQVGYLSKYFNKD